MKKLFTLVVITTMMLSCSNSDEIIPNSKKHPINISLSTQSRVTDSSYEDGDNIGLYVSNYNGGAPSILKTTGNHVDNAKFTNNSSIWVPDEQLFWKDETTATDFYAYYPYQEINDVNACLFAVLQNQSSLESLQSSFFLWGKVVEQMPTEAPIYIETKHLMSSLRIYLEFDESMTDEEKEIYNISDVTVYAKTSAKINIADGTVIANGYNNKIIPYDEGDCYRAIIVPQKNISVSICALGVTHTFDSDVTLQPNTLHNLTINITKDKLTTDITFGIGEWNENTEDNSGTIGIPNLKENIKFSDTLLKEILIDCEKDLDDNNDGEISYWEAATQRYIYIDPLEYSDVDFTSMSFAEFQYFTAVEISNYNFVGIYLDYIELPHTINHLYAYSFGDVRCVRFTSKIPPVIEDGAGDKLWTRGFDEISIEVPQESLNLYKEALPHYAERIRGY